MAIATEDLYERDFYAWTRAQAKALRQMAKERWNGPLDLPRLAEEIQDMGSEQRHAVESQLQRLMEHLLKLEWSVAEAPRRQWKLTCLDARDQIEVRLSPSLRRAVSVNIAKRWHKARRNAAMALEEFGEAEAAKRLPEVCPYTLSQLIDENWWPANRHGIEG